MSLADRIDALLQPVAIKVTGAVRGVHRWRRPRVRATIGDPDGAPRLQRRTEKVVARARSRSTIGINNERTTKEAMTKKRLDPLNERAAELLVPESDSGRPHPNPLPEGEGTGSASVGGYLDCPITVPMGPYIEGDRRPSHVEMRLSPEQGRKLQRLFNGLNAKHGQGWRRRDFGYADVVRWLIDALPEG